MSFPSDFDKLFPKKTSTRKCDNCKYNSMLFTQRQCDLPTCYDGCQCHICINCHGCPGCCLMDYDIENSHELYKLKKNYVKNLKILDLLNKSCTLKDIVVVNTGKIK